MVNKDIKKSKLDKPKRSVTVVSLAESIDNNTGNSGLPQPAKHPEVDLYSKVVLYEEADAKRCSGERDAELFMHTCQEIRGILAKIIELQANSSDQTAVLVAEQQTQATVKIMLLKKLNRLEKMRMKECRDALQKYREQVDSDHLHLQNLLYENIHLGKEVKKCYDFKSIDEDMDLVPIEEFYATAPKNIVKADITKKNPHELKLARLTWELTQRKELASKLKKLEASKEEVTKEIELRKEQLTALGPHLKNIIEATKPLQTLLNIPVDKIKKMHELALLLPKPLYVLFVQAEAYSQLAKWMTVNIIGKEEEACNSEDHFERIVSDSSDSDNEEGAESSRRRKPKRDRRKTGVKDGGEAGEARKAKVMTRHALGVQLNVSVNGGACVCLTFNWLSTLEVVTVAASVVGAGDTGASGIAVADLLASASLLSSMYPGDTGEVCPNPAGLFHLQWAGLAELPRDAGVPYRWAHTLCGLTYLKGQPPAPPSPQLSQVNMESTLRAIKARLRSRLALAKEVKLLECGEALRGKKLQAVITSFTAVSLNDLLRIDSGSRLIQLNIVDNSFLVYRAAIDVHGIKMSAHICLPPTYPNTLPIIVLEVLQNPVLTSLNCDHIRDIEREINTQLASGEEKATNKELLLRQVHSLLLCTELLTATELSPDRPVKAMYFRAVMGRRRSHPYRHMATAGGIFTHR